MPTYTIQSSPAKCCWHHFCTIHFQPELQLGALTSSSRWSGHYNSNFCYNHDGRSKMVRVFFWKPQNSEFVLIMKNCCVNQIFFALPNTSKRVGVIFLQKFSFLLMRVIFTVNKLTKALSRLCTLQHGRRANQANQRELPQNRCYFFSFARSCGHFFFSWALV